MKEKLFYEMQKYDLHFFVGTHAFHQKTWLIIGLFYPYFQDNRRRTLLDY